MSLLFAALVLAGLAGFAVVQPILARRTALVRDLTSGKLLDAEARKRVALTELKEIEYDYLGGKLDETDYREMRVRISREAADAIRAVEAVQGTRVTPAAAPAEGGRNAESGVTHACGWGNPAGSGFCGGCGQRLA
jgi:hypothetical protein